MNAKGKEKANGTGTDTRCRQWTHLHLIALLLTNTAAITLLIGVLLYLFISLHIPNIDSLAGYQPPQTSVILDDQGQVVARFYDQNRIVVDIGVMPDLLAKAFVAAEDGRFYEHGGVDVWSIIRALVHNIQSGTRAQGGSTITQQVARSLLLSPEKTYTRKIKEAILAYRIDHTLSKTDIMHVYLNQIYLGEGTYGVAAAARTYFDKNVSELDLAEISLLAGLPQAPSRYSPFKNYKLAKMRQRYVLNRMAEDGYISPTAARSAYSQILLWAPTSVADRDRYGYFIQQIRNYVEHKYGKQMLETGGLNIYSTLNRQLQKTAEKAVAGGVGAWAGRNKRAALMPQAALIAMEVTSGKVRAVVGGTDYAESQFNRATQARRQPGSAFKPIIYSTAFANGWSPAAVIEDGPLELQGATAGETWKPQNFSGEYYGSTTLYTGLVDSRNIVTIKLLQEIGIGPVISQARAMGIDTPLEPNLSLALGASDLSLLELTSAYGVFAGGGRYTPPIFIEKIVDSSGQVLESNQPAPTQVLDERVAFQVTYLMKKVIEEGTGRKARGLGVPSAGKTGTTDRNMDAWFIGFTPDLVCGVWVGFDDKNSLGTLETGGRAAAPIWLDFMKRALVHTGKADPTAVKARKNFMVPEGITFLPMDPKTGQIGSDLDGFAGVPFLTDHLPTSESAGSEETPVDIGGDSRPENIDDLM